MFDMHTVRLLRDSWELYSADFVEFKQLFRGLSTVGNWESILQEWYDRLSQPNYVKFRTAFNLEQQQFPQIIVNLQEEPTDVQPLGFCGGSFVDSTGLVRRVFTTYLDQTAVIRIFSGTAEHTRALHEFVRQTMISNVAFFGRLGFEGLSYQSGTDLELSPEEMPELLGIYARTQRWRTTYEPQVAAAPIPAGKSVFVHAVDVTINGIDGGVEIAPVEE